MIKVKTERHHHLEISYYAYDMNLKKSLRVVQISDLHYPVNLVALKDILTCVQALNPQAIFVSGDLYNFTMKASEMDALVQFYHDLERICSVYWVRGNHELKTIDYQNIKRRLQLEQIHYCSNQVFDLSENVVLQTIDEVTRFQIPKINPQKINVWLVHRPETFHFRLPKHCYQFSGHVHGGQFRLFNQGIFGPDQGFLLRYSKGYYPLDTTSGLFVSAGLGRSSFPFRLFNPAHLIVVDF